MPMLYQLGHKLFKCSSCVKFIQLSKRPLIEKLVLKEILMSFQSIDQSCDHIYCKLISVLKKYKTKRHYEYKCKIKYEILIQSLSEIVV